MSRVSGAIMNNVATPYISNVELSEKMRCDTVGVIDSKDQAIAIIRSHGRSGRLISECIKSAGYTSRKVFADDAFAQDVEDGIRDRQQAWNPPDLW